MFLADQNTDTHLTVYEVLFDRLANGQDVSSQKEIDEALKFAKKVYAQKASIYSAPSNYFYLITFLLSHGREVVSSFDVDEINSAVYSKVSKLIAAER